MKRLAVFSILVIGVMLLSACAGSGAGDQTPVGGTGLPGLEETSSIPETGGFPETEETSVIPETGATLESTMPPVGTSVMSTPLPTTALSTSTRVVSSTSIPTTDAVVSTSQPTSVVGSTSVATSMPTTVGTGVVGIPPTGSADLPSLSEMLKMRVVDTQGNELGRVTDFVVNVCEAHIVYIAIDAASSNAGSGQSTSIPATGSLGQSTQQATGTVSATGIPATGAGNTILIPYQAAWSMVAGGQGTVIPNTGSLGTVMPTGIVGTAIPATGLDMSGKGMGTAISGIGTAIPSTGGMLGTLQNQGRDVIVVDLKGAGLDSLPRVDLNALDMEDAAWEDEIIDFWSSYYSMSLTTNCNVPARSGTAQPAGTVIAGTVIPQVNATPLVSGTAVSPTGVATRISDRVDVTRIALASDLLNASVEEGNRSLVAQMRDAVVIKNAGAILYYIVQPVAGNQQGLGAGRDLIALPPGALNVRHDGQGTGQTVMVLLVPTGALTGAPAYTGSFDTANSQWATYWSQYVPLTQEQLP